MPFIPHTQQDILEMLDEIGVKNIKNLFDEIPIELITASIPEIPPPLNEMNLSRLIKSRASKDQYKLNFIGAGAYEHHIPAAVWEIASRGEWMTAYTPYQAEASQGSLQLLYEFQSMMTNLMEMDVSNASLYDGASGLAEAILMAVRLTAKKNLHRILIPRTLHPNYLETIKTIIQPKNIELIEIPFDLQTGNIKISELEKFADNSLTALIIQQPNFFGILEEVDALTDWAHKNNSLVIASVNPLAIALLTPPGKWGKNGADIVSGEGQPLGIPLSSGGPYYGFLCCKKSALRQLPGRIVGKTIDKNDQTGFVLTAQAREQHIRRGRATSNICTNQGLLVTASTIYMSLLGSKGLTSTAIACNTNSNDTIQQLVNHPKIKKAFNGTFFHECVLQFEQPLEPVLSLLEDAGIIAGLPLKPYYPELGEALLICTTETKTSEDIKSLTDNLKEALRITTCQTTPSN